jgi:flagellar basal-body rod protein FlgG
MNYGMWVAASGVMSNIARQNVLSNNLANVSTVGFKADRLPIRQREPVRAEDGLPHLDSNAMLERLGAGVMPMATETAFSQGPIRDTHNPLDLAITGEGFFRVRADTERGFALTRDGRLTVNAAGVLARSTDGAPVLDATGNTIAVDRTMPIRIDEGGNVTQRGASRGRIDVVAVSDPALLHKAGEGNFALKPTASANALTLASDALIRAGAVEDSGVNPIATLMGVTGASRAAQGGLRMVSTINEITGLAINRLGKVS